MSTLVISAALLVGFPIALLLIFQANSGVMFFAACAGIVLLESLDPTVVTTAGAVIPKYGESYIRLVVPLLSIVFAAMMFRGSSGKRGQLFLHILIGLLIGLMLWLLLPGATGVSWLVDNINNDIWQTIDDFRTLIIAAGFGLSLLAVLMNGRFGKHAKHSGKH